EDSPVSRCVPFYQHPEGGDSPVAFTRRSPRRSLMAIRGVSHDKPSKARPTRRAVLRLSGGAALASALVGIQGLSRSAFSEDERAGWRAIDTHIHVVPSNLPGIKPKPKDVETLYEGPPSEMVARLKVEMHLARFEVAFGMGCLGGPPADPLGIAGTLAL